MIRKECNKFSDICDSMSDWYKPLAWVLLFFGSAACTEGPIVPEPEPEPSGFTIHMDEENIVEYQEDEQGIYPHLYTLTSSWKTCPQTKRYCTWADATQTGARSLTSAITRLSTTTRNMIRSSNGTGKAAR